MELSDSYESRLCFKDGQNSFVSQDLSFHKNDVILLRVAVRKSLFRIRFNELLLRFNDFGIFSSAECRRAGTMWFQ